jgi:hypothetical protein
MGTRAEQLAARVEQGAHALAASVEGLSEAEWQQVCTDDGRTVGVLVHHVASAYPVEMDLVQQLASGQGVVGVTWDMVNQMNAQHAQTHASATREETLDLLRQNSSQAAAVIRGLSDEQLDRASPISLNWDAPLTTQFFIEDHPLSHSFRHLSSIRAAFVKR